MHRIPEARAVLCDAYGVRGFPGRWQTVAFSYGSDTLEKADKNSA